MTLEQFIQLELERTGRSVYTLDDVERLVEEWRQVKAAATEPDDIDALLFGCRASGRGGDDHEVSDAAR